MPSFEWFEQFWLSVRTAPAAYCAPAVVGLFAGLLLLLAGGKVLRPMIVLVGVVVGGLVGTMVIPRWLPAGLEGLSAPATGTLIGSVIGLVTSFVLFRAAMAAAGGLTFAAAGVLIAGVCLMTANLAEAEFAGAEAKGGVTMVLVSTQVRGDSAAVQVSDSPVSGAAQLVAEGAWDTARGAWERLSAESRLRLITAGLGAGMLGLLVGAIMPRRAAALVTSLLGAGVFLISLTWLVRVLDLPGSMMLNRGAMGWLVIWLVCAAAGMCFQVASGGAKRAGPAPA